MAKKSRKQKKQAALDTAPATKTPKTPGRGAWRVMDKGSAVAAGLLATRASAIAWRAVTGKKPPISGRHPEVGTKEAVAWAMVGGAVVELVKVGVRRGAATYWVKSTGKLPPGMKPVKTLGNAQEPVPEEPAPNQKSAKRASNKASTKKVSRRSRGR